MSLREQFEKEQKEKHQNMMDTLFETGSQHYIAWLESIIQTHLKPQQYNKDIKFKLGCYYPSDFKFLAHTEDGSAIFLDLDTDSSFPELSTDDIKNALDYANYMKSLEGKYIECESISPYTPVYFVRNAKFINSF
jgi:hypothetical protein